MMQPWRALCTILNRAAGLVSVQGIRQELAALATKVAGTVTPLLRQKPGKTTADHCSQCQWRSQSLCCFRPDSLMMSFCL